MRLKKRGMVIGTDWAEFFFLVLLVIGFIVALSLKNAFITYVMIMVFGIMCGRFIQKRSKGFPFYMIAAGFLLGFMIGARHVAWSSVLILFIAASIGSFYFHKKQILSDVFEKKWISN
jgi:hypothetical protein